MNETEVLTPETRTIHIGGKEFVIGRLTLLKSLKMVREVTSLAASVYLRINEANQGASVKGMSAQEVMPFFWAEMPKVVPILACVIDVEPSWLENQTIEEVSELLNAVVVLNNWKRIIENFTIAFSKMKTEWQEVTKVPETGKA